MDAQTLVDERGELWLALAPLWLEHEPSERGYTQMLAVIEHHELTVSELEWIFRLELAPVLARHQLSVVSEWRHFDEYKLMQQLVAHNMKLKGWRRKGWALFSGLTTMMTRQRWNELISRLIAKRNATLP